MMLARHQGQTRTAEPGLTGGTCPLCDGPVIAKCGEVNIWHWAHRTADCDPWAEPMSQWHLDWQQLVPQDRREVVIANHRADILTPRGLVVEIQRSPLSTADITERETHYTKHCGGMVWIFDVAEAAGPNQGQPWGKPEQTPRLHVIAPKHAETDYRTFRWSHARKSIGACTHPVFLDLGSDLLLLGGPALRVGEGPSTGWGHLWTRQQVANALNEPFEEAS